MGKGRGLAAVCAAVLLLAGCAAGKNAGPAALAATAAATAESGGAGYCAPELQLSPFHADTPAQNGVQIDTSAVALGYVAVSAHSGQRLKFQVVYGDTKYNYDLPGDGTPVSYPLQSGSGAYTFRVMQNTAGSKYAELSTAVAQVELQSELEPFLRPSQLVSYSAGSACVQKAAELAAAAGKEADVVSAVYAYICDHIVYDTEKAKTVQDGYLPDPDATLAAGSGICFDYAALAAAMLRSQGIPTKMITGYVGGGEIYHAWNMIWLKEQGWITVRIEAPANSWNRIDLTFAAGAGAAFAGDGTEYADLYTY